MKDLIHPTQLRDTDQMSINQIAHGFAIGDYIIYDKTTSSWKKANIIGNYAVGSIGRVVDVESANSLEIKVFGIIVDYTGLTAGEFYYAKDDGTGGLTITPPTSVIQAVLFALPGNKAVELSYPAVTPSAPITPSSTPLGYNDLRTSFTGANWNYEGLTNNGGGISLSGSIAVSGAIAGWRYLVVDPLGVVSVETIPPAEIIADTQQYTPNPVFDVANNGYYSSVNPTYRIIAIGYFDGTNLLETISYGNGKRKNDDWYFTPNLSTSTSTINERLQLDAAFDRSRGTNFTVIDNGVGVTDSEGGRITIVGDSGVLVLDVNLVASSFTDVLIHINKKGVFYDRVDAYQTAIAVITSFTRHTTMRIPVQKGDYFVMNAAAIATGSVAIQSISITFEEN